MNALDIKKATLIGHSYGGRIIIKLASRENLPFEINNIVLIDSAGIMPKRTFKQKFRIIVTFCQFCRELPCFLQKQIKTVAAAVRRGVADFAFENKARPFKDFFPNDADQFKDVR